MFTDVLKPGSGLQRVYIISVRLLVLYVRPTVYLLLQQPPSV